MPDGETLTQETPVTVEQFGRDHWSTLTYLETREVDDNGKIRNANMRTDPSRHPLFVDTRFMGHGGQHPTRLAGGARREHHDDWDCLHDFVRLGFVSITRIAGVNVGRMPVPQRQRYIDYYFDVAPGSRGPIKDHNGRISTRRMKEVEIALTSIGRDLANRLRAHKAGGRNFEDFKI